MNYPYKKIPLLKAIIQYMFHLVSFNTFKKPGTGGRASYAE